MVASSDMAISKDKIEVFTKSYFSESQLQDFLAIIKYWNERSVTAFFQVVQKQEKPVIELACLVNRTIYDITYASDNVRCGVLPLAQIKSAILNRDSSSSELIFFVSDTTRFVYKATTEQFRKDLEDFALHIQMLIAGER